jgi:hypothetical protein
VPERTPSDRLADRLVVTWFLFVFLALLWPLYLPAARVRPLVLGMPFSLFWIAALLVVSFLVLLAYYRARGTDEDGDA